ncbi:flagellar hook-basal body complex protein FliE [Nocardioides ferulae]|uniref:flagellar hook-basal body complex protein FliE n=1 Tax=Nocardioides ferulae TaxID=2340821 RepID=UPI000EB4560E|nr:flagellar hook-basal body complex protein FliE [Nocardioides ferulae]
MSINGIEAIGFTPMQLPQVAGPDSVGAARLGSSVPSVESSSGVDFGEFITDSLDRLDGVQRSADRLAVQAATGDLDSIHDYTLAATEASVTTQLTTAVRNKALESFNEIMRMQV